MEDARLNYQSTKSKASSCSARQSWAPCRSDPARTGLGAGMGSMASRPEVACRVGLVMLWGRSEGWFARHGELQAGGVMPHCASTFLIRTLRSFAKEPI